ncbi:hypothetical protein N7541_010628 [Penicillium brevicompactum]|uniref:Transcription factor domain-containing protein n=1 Tax=Penicillium brevicompactum TaxID=5074 RepID=A0A9W9QRW9_PENBR|nr:hypothetical protein N7541_010628 [Penicillium brevicompactum]
MWVGQKAAYERFEGDRGDLAVHCRRGQLLDCRAKAATASQPSSDRNRSRMEDTWVGWINEEQKKRLGLCIYRQPYLSKAETANTALPCSNMFWKAPTAWAWKSLLGPADIPPSTYFIPTLTTILLHNDLPDVLPFPPLDDFCKTLYAYVLHTHVFEWRQTICMLNPTGLLSSPLSLAPQNIGESLQERREWLVSCLKNWDTFYGNDNQADPTNRNPKNSSGILLFHLAMLALHLNFSDLHMVTGRSGSEADIKLAKQSLRNWLQKERVQKIFDCNTRMLNAAHDAITAGDAQRSGFELAICLFMGGLTSWAISRFGSPVRISMLGASRQYAGGQNFDQYQSNPELCTESSFDPRDELNGQVSNARDGLRSLKCFRLAVAFGDILELHSGPD